MVLRRVCESYNSGWMKAIVDNSIDIIKSLVNQVVFNLSIDDKKKIASWVVLTAIHYDYLLSYKHPNASKAISQEDLDFMHTNHHPSERFEVYISRTDDPEFQQNIWGFPHCLRAVGSGDENLNAFDFLYQFRM